MKKTRRNFIKTAGTFTLGGVLLNTLPISTLSAMRKKISANEKVNFGLIGCNGMGSADMKNLLQYSEADCIAICDVDKEVISLRKKEFEEITGHEVKVYSDYRKLLENNDIDSVVIGTPDHWHCLMLVDAVESGKHVYCEKPIANSIYESYAMLNAVKRTNKIVQVGQWQRSGKQYKEALDYLWSGKLGDIRVVKVWAYQGWMKKVINQPDSKTPKGVDYKMWLGPAPKRKFNPNRFHFNFRWYWDYAGGLMTDWGVHEIDIALYGMKAKDPISVVASGGNFGYPNQDIETPDTLQTIFKYDDFTMIWEHAQGIDGGNYGKDEGIAFIGNKGTLVVNRGGWEVIPEIDYSISEDDRFMEPVPYEVNYEQNPSPLSLHTKNFLDAIKNNSPESLNCGIESGSVACINAHMGNISYLTGEKVYWDKDKKLFINNHKANELIKPSYNNGWKLPNL